MMENLKDIHDLTFDIKHNTYSKKTSKLIILGDSLVFQPNRKFNKKVLRIPTEDIQDFRYGVKWLQGLRFTIGREYQLFIRTIDNQEISIRTRTYYGFKRNLLHSEFYKLVNQIWNTYFLNKTQELVNKYVDGESIQVCEVLVSSDGINIESGGSFNRNRVFIPWEHVGSQTYQTSYTLFSKENPIEINKAYYYMTDWNISVLRSLIETILKIRNPQEV